MASAGTDKLIKISEKWKPTELAAVLSVMDPAKVASCLPDVQSHTVRDAEHVDVVARVGVGPVRGGGVVSTRSGSGSWNVGNTGGAPSSAEMAP